jgi:hypothetical protein
MFIPSTVGFKYDANVDIFFLIQESKISQRYTFIDDKGK